uniref:Protein LURP-one-related 8-like n=1 Tax=Tanacetum cinerariifolium TaxID=118510 RepID=A0A6L2KQF5_TANCI|nr:protein LURP-one-related 8-like [Tanacetum cinerariifolium]
MPWSILFPTHGHISTGIPRQSSPTQEYLSLIDTFFVAHTVNGVFTRDEDRLIYEMRRLEATGTYTDDEINRLARRGKQRGHILGVGRFESAGASGNGGIGGCGDDEESADDQEDENEDGDGDIAPERRRFLPESSTAGRSPVVLTVWKKSLLFNCDGFTVYDTKGNLVFRVDNYANSNKSEVVLMDSSGHSLITIRRKKLSLTDSWLVYNGETTSNPRFSVTKHVNFLSAKSLAHVSNTGSPPRNNNNKKNIAYEIEGSYAQRSCVVYDDKRRPVAEIKRKEALRGVPFGGDVFRLVVQPEIDPTVAMALVVLLDQMFGGSSRRFQT